jgi:hemolysin III
MKIKDPISGISHLLGVILSVPGTIILLINSDNLIESFSFLIFGLTIFILYTASTIYHFFEGTSENNTGILRKIDHASIYLLIAGSFIPFCTILIKGAWGWSVLIIVWVLAILGASTKFINISWKMPRWLSANLYIFMGLISLALLYPLRIYPEIIIWLFIGGFFYIVGAIIYIIKKPNISKLFGFHELFHIFILLGTASHFWSIYKYIALR